MFVNVPEILAPTPFAAIPVRFTVLVLVQMKVVPTILFGFVILIEVIAVPEQTVWLIGEALTFGFGFTATVSVKVAEEQPFADAVMVKYVVCGEFVVLVKVPEMLAPIPTAAIPVRLIELSLVQLNVVPGIFGGSLIVIKLTGDPEQTV